MTKKDMMQNTVVARTFIDEALDCGRRANVDMPLLLDGLGLTEGDLDHLNTDQFGDIWLELSFCMQDEFFGLGKRPMRPGSFTLLGHAVRSSKNLEIAIKRTLRFLTVVLDEPHGRLEIGAKHAKIFLSNSDAPMTPFAYRAFFLIVHSLNCWLISERIPVRSIMFPCKEPEGTNDYSDFFGVPVTFDTPAACLTFDRKYLQKLINRSEQALKIFLKAAPAAFLNGYRHDDGLKARITAELSTNETDSWLRIDEIASRLGLSISTLHRRLKEEGQTFGEIKEERRRNLAVSLLKKTDMKITEVAHRIGYSEPSAFFRAFRKWYGTTPSEIRGSRRSNKKSLDASD